MLIYVIQGDPIALARPRVGYKKVYDSQKNLKLVASIELEGQHEGVPFSGKALHLDVTFFMPFPQNMSLIKQEKLTGTHHIFRPDLSNMIKFIEDIATGIIYNDDCLIASVTAKKSIR